MATFKLRCEKNIVVTAPDEMVKEMEDGYGIVFHNEYDSIQTIVMLDREWEKGPTIRDS